MDGTTMEEPEELTFHDLQEITDCFSEKRIVGEGAFGTVYKGVTKHGEDVAVKILRDGNPDLGYRQFQNEFYNLLKVKHDNIVQVLGYCYEIEQTRQEYDGRIVLAQKTHRALCFEYLHNGSLQNHLSDESCGLDWHTRYKIIKGTCEGLRYIHEEKCLLHLDIKPENILLDKNMVPKIADFGLSRIFGDKVTRTTRSPLGTLGYQPPEYIESGKISEKFDIFSLGVVIMRIVSGPDGYPKCRYMPSDTFIDQIQNKWRAKWQETCSSGFLLEACCHQVKTCTQIALDCLENDSQERPDIVKIIDELKEIETDNNKEPQVLQLYENGHKTVCGMTRRNEMKLTNEHKVITDKHQNLNFMISSGSNEVESDNTQETLLDVGEEQIVGRDEETRKIVASLLESIKPEKTVIILPIYGIGGIGKTTLAKLIYNDTNFKYYSHVWVYLSQRFDMEKIDKSIRSQLSGNQNQEKEQLISKEEILIVLDDLWEDNPLKIEELKNLLILCDSIKTIIVLVTTRSADIARKICTNFEPYQIGPLTDEICWDIIKQNSGFTAMEDKEKLVDIGKEIAHKCEGVALAAQTLGSMLRSMKHDEWITVKDSDIWNETISEDNSLPQHILASLKLTYAFSMDDLLKRCFTYCAIFPKGQKIVKYDLIYQWISLGFIMPTKILSTFQRCEKYILRLVGLSFLQHSMPPTNYGAYADGDTVFTMHDLVHDLAVSLGDEILDQSKQGSIEGSNYRYALLNDCSTPLGSCTVSPATLTALHFVDCRQIELHSAAFELAESLRVLDLSGCLIHELPDSVGQLKQLGYFNAPRIRGPKIPESITALSNLRYLCLRGSCFIQALPESIGEMIDLVHLDLSGCLGIKKLPESFGNLTNLVYVDFANCKHLTGVSQCLVNLTKLQHLNLSNCKNIGDLPGALGILTELQYLNLSDSSYLSGNKLSVAEFRGPLTQFKYFLGSLTKLKYLNLSSSSIYTNMSSSNERRIISSPEALLGLTALKYLNLSHHYVMGKLLPSFGNLCKLVHLDLSYCYPLQGVPEALNGLTKLQYLDLYKCSGFYAMEGLPEAFGNLSELRHLNLGCCIGEMSSYHPDKINGLLASICTLTNLEYLSLRENNSIYSIPETLANLRNLHTLDLSSCSSLQKLPAIISEIGSLKFLYTKECRNLDRSMLHHYKSSRVSEHFESHTGRDGESSSFVFQFDYSNPAQLNISGLENDAQIIKLAERTDITQLALEWTGDEMRSVDDSEVLSELEPPYSVSEFRLQGYNSVSFPSWVMRIDAYLPSLITIDMCDLPNCNNLPPLGRLPKLERLKIRRIDSIKKIDVDLYGGTTAFPRLKEFHIDSLKCLEEWNTAYSSGKFSRNGHVFPCLRNVEIRHCPRLRFKPGPPPITLSYGSLLRQGPFFKCSSNDLTCSSNDFPRGLSALETLTVEDCESITSLPETLGDLVSLRELHILDCMGIRTLPDSIQKLYCLGRLVIIGCPELGQWCKSEKNSKKLAHITISLGEESDDIIDTSFGSPIWFSIVGDSLRKGRRVTIYR